MRWHVILLQGARAGELEAVYGALVHGADVNYVDSFTGKRAVEEASDKVRHHFKKSACKFNLTRFIFALEIWSCCRAFEMLGTERVA